MRSKDGKLEPTYVVAQPPIAKVESCTIILHNIVYKFESPAKTKAAHEALVSIYENKDMQGMAAWLKKYHGLRVGKKFIRARKPSEIMDIGEYAKDKRDRAAKKKSKRLEEERKAREEAKERAKLAAEAERAGGGK